MSTAQLQREVDQLLARIRDLESELARLREPPETRRGFAEIALVGLHGQAPASAIGAIDADDVQEIHTGEANVLEVVEGETESDLTLRPIENSDGEDRITLTYLNPGDGPAGSRADAGENFFAVRLRDGRWYRMTGAGSRMFRFILLEDARTEDSIGVENRYKVDIRSMSGSPVQEDANLVDTFGWMYDLLLRANDVGLCVKEGELYYYVTSDCGSIGDCTEGPFLNAQSPATGQVGQAYSWTPTAEGATVPDTWSAAGLPAGLSIDPDSGEISGTPTTAGTFLVTVQAIRGGCTATKIVTITITAAPTPPPLP